MYMQKIMRQFHVPISALLDQQHCRCNMNHRRIRECRQGRAFLSPKCYAIKGQGSKLVNVYTCIARFNYGAEERCPSVQRELSVLSGAARFLCGVVEGLFSRHLFYTCKSRFNYGTEEHCPSAQLEFMPRVWEDAGLRGPSRGLFPRPPCANGRRV
jgi:hypothetical protein